MIPPPKNSFHSRNRTLLHSRKIGKIIARLAKDKDLAVGTTSTEMLKLKNVLWAHHIMKNSEPWRQRELLHTHGLSLPELADLARHYALRVQNSHGSTAAMMNASAEFNQTCREYKIRVEDAYRHHKSSGRN